MAPNNNVDRYWAGVGPKYVSCNNPNCTSSIYTGVLVHKKLKLGLKPTCLVCKREYKIPLGAEKPYIKGGGGNHPPKGTNTGPRKWGGGDDKDKEIAKLQKIIQDKGLALPSNPNPTYEQKAQLDKYKLTRAAMAECEQDTTGIDVKILELEQANKAADLPYSVVEAKLKTARLKLQRHVNRYENLQAQIQECQKAGCEVSQQIEELELQAVKAISEKGYVPKALPDEDRPPPANLKLEQKEAWLLAVQNHKVQMAAQNTKATETFSKMLFDMENNYQEANKREPQEMPVAPAPAATEPQPTEEELSPESSEPDASQGATLNEKAKAYFKRDKRDLEDKETKGDNTEQSAKKVFIGMGGPTDASILSAAAAAAAANAADK